MTETTAPAVPTLEERMQRWAQHGITQPRIIERQWRGTHPISPEIFNADMQYAAQLHARQYEWSGTDRAGNPMVIAWWAGQRAGKLFSAYEITQRGE